MDINSSDEVLNKINLITLGDISVGKTCYILKFTEDFFQPIHLSTIGIDFKKKKVTINNKNYTVFFYDTTGQERFRSIALNIVKNADGILLMYDITERDSFKAISEWMNSIKQIKKKDFPIILIGNMFNLQGVKVATLSLNNGAIDIRQLPKGVYVVSGKKMIR